MGLKQLLDWILSIEANTGYSTVVCGCMEEVPLSVPKEIKAGVDFGGFQEVVVDILIPSLVATLALKEVLIKRKNEDGGGNQLAVDKTPPAASTESP